MDHSKHDHNHHGETGCIACYLVYPLTIAFTICGIYSLYQTTLGKFYLRMAFYYFTIFLAAIFSCFVTPYTFFHNMGCTAAMTIFKWISSLWLDIEVEVRGAEKIAEASGPEKNPVVLISNHQSSLDVYVMSQFWPEKCTALIKSSLKYIPFFNFSSYLSNSIYVNRYNKNEAHRAIDDAVEAMRGKKLKIWVFPEGTRHHGTGLLEFKKGAFNIAVKANFPIIPIVISTYTPFYSCTKEEKYFHSKGKVIVQVMDPIPTDELELDDVPKLCDDVRSKMADVLQQISDEMKSN